MDDFIVSAFFAGLAVIVISGPLGSLMVWRRMAYFGDTLSHSALLGVAIGIVASISIDLSILLLCLAAAVLMFFFQKEDRLGNDTLLGILAHSALALGVIVLSFTTQVNFDIESYLFGDILAVTNQDVLVMCSVSIIGLLTLKKLWKPLLAISIHKDLARVEGVNVSLTSFFYLLMIASLIAVAMKVVGMLLITALMIIPAATARRFSKTPEQMAAYAILLGTISLFAGLLSSLQWDTPTGPSIIVAASTLFFLTLLVPDTSS